MKYKIYAVGFGVVWVVCSTYLPFMWMFLSTVWIAIMILARYWSLELKRAGAQAE